MAELGLLALILLPLAYVLFLLLTSGMRGPD